MDKVADLLIRIKNGYLARRSEVLVSFSKLNQSICQLLIEEGYLTKAESSGREIKLTLKYENRQPSLTDVRRISKPGRRVYKSSKVLPKVYDGLGIAIISTPKGIKSDRQARKENLGGEVMAFVW